MFPLDDVIMTHTLEITSLTPEQQDFEGYLKDMDQICRRINTTKGFFYWQEWSAIQSWTTNNTYHNVCGETIYPFPKFQRCNRRSLGMGKHFHPTLFWAPDYLSMLGLVLNLVNILVTRGLSKHAVNLHWYYHKDGCSCVNERTHMFQ